MWYSILGSVIVVPLTHYRSRVVVYYYIIRPSECMNVITVDEITVIIAIISLTLRQPPFKVESKDGHYSNTQRQLYSLKSLLYLDYINSVERLI